MTSLKCSASTCIYNDNHLCSRGNISVNGEDATHADETCCASFQERIGSARNSVDDDCGCPTVQISCKAKKCTYNEHHHCSADSIGVSGSHAQTSGETKCDTFACKC